MSTVQADKMKLSIFPLIEVVLFPGMDLPLHIFEDRYKKLISKCLEQKEEFGIVLIKDNVCAEVGTTAEIIDVEALDDGKMNILAEGRRRFKILDVLKENPYLEALVSSYEDVESKIDNRLKSTIKEIKQLSTKVLNIFDLIADQELSKKLKLPKEPNELLFLIAANLTCTFEAKQSILEMTSIKERSNKILALLKEEIQRLEVMLENKNTKEQVVKNGKLHF